MTIADTLVFLFVGACIVGIALVGALTVGLLIGLGVVLARFVAKKLPDVWNKIVEGEFL